MRALLIVLLFLLAAGAALAFGFGHDPRLMRFDHGLELIIWARRMQWLTAGLALLFSVGAITVVLAMKRRIWWLIGLAPVFILFVHRFSGVSSEPMSVADNPAVVDAKDATFVRDEDFVVGVVFNKNAYAYPYRELMERPVVVQIDQDKRMLLMWSAYANRAVAYVVKGEIRARDLEIVSTPANALLVYNSRRGQFINGVTGKTKAGEVPAGVVSSLATWKMDFGQWCKIHPKTKVMGESRESAGGPTAMLLPKMPMPRSATSDTKKVLLVGTTQPAALEEEKIGAKPVNAMAGKLPVMIVREGARIWCFNRMLEDDQPAQFGLNTDPKRKGTYIDNVTKSTWSISEGQLRAIDGPAATKPAKALHSVAIDTALPWNVMKYWYPNLELVEGKELAEERRPVRAAGARGTR